MSLNLTHGGQITFPGIMSVFTWCCCDFIPRPVSVGELFGMRSSPQVLFVRTHISSLLSTALQMFAYAAREHCQQHGTQVEHFAKITSKNRRHGAQNPRAAIQVTGMNGPVALDWCITLSVASQCFGIRFSLCMQLCLL